MARARVGLGLGLGLGGSGGGGVVVVERVIPEPSSVRATPVSGPGRSQIGSMRSWT